MLHGHAHVSSTIPVLSAGELDHRMHRRSVRRLPVGGRHRGMLPSYHPYVYACHPVITPVCLSEATRQATAPSASPCSKRLQP
eukprot:scaffold34239_cov66-Phaeocystis_antarctica.AAC.1